MNKLEANLVLLCVTFFWGIQYIFLSTIPEGVSTFAFITITNAIGFLLVAIMFFSELNKLTKKLCKNSLIMAGLTFAFNTLLTMGAREVEASTVSFLAAAYIVFIPVIMLFAGMKVQKQNIIGVVLAIAGLLLATGASMRGGLQKGVLLIMGADVFFAVYVVSVEKMVEGCNPVLLSVGQMFFGSFLGLFAWLATESHRGLQLPSDPSFWSSVLVIALFIRGFSTVMQMYAQRYVTALNASLIFSTEIIITLATSLFLPAMLGIKPESITMAKGIGCLTIILGVLVSDGTIGWRRRKVVKT